jgi:hypothetical protein
VRSSSRSRRLISIDAPRPSARLPIGSNLSSKTLSTIAAAKKPSTRRGVSPVP